MFSFKVGSQDQTRLAILISYVSIFFNILAALLYTPWMISKIGQADYGIYSLLISLVSLFALDFGLGAAVSRFLATYKAVGDRKGARRFLGLAYKLFIVIACIIFIILTAIYYLLENIYTGLTIQEIEKFRTAFLVIGIFTVVSFPFKPFDGILIANERFVYYKLVELLQRVLNVFLLVLVLTLGYGLFAIVVINSLTGLLIILMKYIYIKKTTDLEVELSYYDNNLFKEIFTFSSWITIIMIAQRFIINITPTILGSVSGTAAIAIFSIGTAIEAYTYTFSQALGGLFLTKVIKSITNNDDLQEVERLSIKVGRIQLIVIGLLITGFIVMGKEFILLWVGEKFLDSYYVAVLLIIPTIITFTQEIQNNLLIALNQINYKAMAYLIVGAISMLLSLILSPEYGAIGSAIAICIGNIIGNVGILNLVYYKVYKLNIFQFFYNCHFKILVSLVLTLCIGLLIQYAMPAQSFFLFIIKSSFLASFYFVTIWFSFLNEYEKSLVLDLFRKINSLLRG